MAVTAQQFHFGEFTLDQSQYRLQRADRVVRLEKRPMELLILLVERQGELVSRDDIATRLWAKDVFVDVEHGINTAVRKVRQALRDDPEKPRFVETVVGKGYRFAAPVTSSSNGVSRAAAPADIKPAAQPSASSIPTAVGAAQALAPRTTAFGQRAFLIAATALLTLALAVAAVLIPRRNVPPAATQPVKSIAVLPLKNLSGDASQEYLVDGMTEALIARLSAIHDLRVISRTSVMHFKDTQLSIPEIAKTLQVDALVEGSVIRQGDRIRVTAQLIRGATDEHFWSETYDRDLPDVLALQSDVAQSIANKVEVTVTGKERERLASAHRVSPEAYQSFLKGRYVFANTSTRAGIEESIRYFEEAIRIDPKFAPAYAYLAGAHQDLGTILMGGRPDTERAEVISDARKALELDPNLSEAHNLLASVLMKQWHWAESEAEYRHAIDLNPNDAGAYAGLGEWLLCHGRFDEAMVMADRERTLDRSGSSSHTMAWTLFHARRYDEEIRELRDILPLHPHDLQCLWDLGFALIMQGHADQAVPILQEAVSLSRRSPGTIDLLAAAYARSGHRAEALRLLEELKARQKTGYVPAGSFVITYISLGDYEQAFTWLEQAYKEQSNLLQFVKVHPIFDPLRSDPRFADLVRRIGL